MAENSWFVTRISWAMGARALGAQAKKFRVFAQSYRKVCMSFLKNIGNLTLK